MKMILCTRCETSKPTSEFYRPKKAKVRPDGYTHWCKECYAQNYKNNSERQKRSNQAARVLRQYGLTPEEYAALIESGCSVCGPRARGRVVMDHCHSSGKVRGPLCDGCNKALGCAEDDPELLRALAAYVERHDRM